MHPHRPIILLIDDDLPTIELYRRELSRGYQVLTCSEERRALELLETEDVSAVVLEPVALGERGWSLLTMIKTQLAPRRVPVILCSTQDERRRGLEMGAAACLVKPVLPMTLRRVVDHVTRNPV